MTCILAGNLEKAQYYNQHSWSPMEKKYVEELYKDISGAPDGQSAQILKKYLSETSTQKKA